MQSVDDRCEASIISMTYGMYKYAILVMEVLYINRVGNYDPGLLIQLLVQPCQIFCACKWPGTGFPTPYDMVFLCSIV